MNTIFKNTEIAFSLKSNIELKRAIYLFKIIQSPLLVKISTSLVQIALKLHLPVQWLIRKTIYKQFCGGISEKECIPLVTKMYEKGVCSVLDYSVEGKQNDTLFDVILEKTIEILMFSSKREEIPFVVFKPSGMGRSDLYTKKSNNTSLTKEEKEEWERIVNRFERICSAAFEYQVPVMIDAEHSWMQTSVDNLVESMMEKYNTEKAIVSTTLQMYRWDRMKYLENLYEEAVEKSYFIGIKLVRGAYMEEERSVAQKKGYASPICPDKTATDLNYNEAITFILNHMDRISLFAGSHNEESMQLIIEKMEKDGISKVDKRIFFSQLYGMGDQISFNLGVNGYCVAKYLPFGPVRDLMPYLIRRAEENTSIAGQTGRELQLIITERKRRKGLST